MRQLTDGMLNAIAGSVPDAKIIVSAWYDGALKETSLQVPNWEMKWDGADSNQVQGKASITVTDPTGRLAPWGFDEPLSAAGSRLLMSFQCGNESVELAWFTISRNKPTEQWRIVGPNLKWVPGGASIPVEADDLTLLIADAPFIAPEAPPTSATVVSEVRRLVAGICPVTIAAGVVDQNVPASIVYNNSRLTAIQDLVISIGCRYRMTGSGALEVYPLTKTVPVWTIQGKDGGALVSVDREQARADLINGVVSTANDPSLEIRELVTITAGPLRWDGPFGRKTMSHTALTSTQAGVQQDAQSMLDNQVMLKTMPLTVMCTPHPGIQIGDWVRVAQPTINGAEFPLDGIVSAVQLKGSTAGVDPMQLTVQCSVADVQAVGLSVRGAA